MRLLTASPILVVLVVAAVAVAFPTPVVEAGLPQQYVAAAPGAWLSTYASPAVAVEVDGALSFLNADIMRHDVVSEAAGAGDQPWCLGFPAGSCPLFWSPLIGLGEEAPVSGLDTLVAGTTYAFYCTLHPGMSGTLVALPNTG